jgi:hypothetical protein
MKKFLVTLFLLFSGAVFAGSPNLLAKPVPLNPFLHAYHFRNGVKVDKECGWIKTATTQQMQCDLSDITTSGSYTFTAIYVQEVGVDPVTGTVYVAGTSVPSNPFSASLQGPPASPSELLPAP